MKPMSNPNLFTYYQQEENQFTNGLISILNLSRFESESFVSDFFKKTLSINISQSKLNFKVLEDIEGTADAEISNEKVFLLIETKIRSGALRREQIQSHIKNLNNKNQKNVNLILLTPDDSQSKYIKDFMGIDSHIIHIGWKKVYNYLDNYIKNNTSLFTEIILQYQSLIHDNIFEQDIVALIVKIAFGDKSEVYHDKYLDEMKRGEWTDWGTPRNYKNLDGQGRKLILYDKTRNALTVEVEIKKIKKEENSDYPYRNIFVPNSLRIFDKPIPVSKVRQIKGFENFGIHRKDRNPYRNLTHEQYKELMS